ncbi:MAG: SAM-dependent methyltransferase [Nevskiales bacterium]
MATPASDLPFNSLANRLRPAPRSSWVWSILKRLFLPRHALQVWRLERSRKQRNTVFDDSQLLFYAEFLPSGFLHYGYFDEPNLPPEQISLGALEQAQRRYADKLLELIRDRQAPVLDVGCGMGGLVRLLSQQGYTPVALTPDRSQAANMKAQFPNIELIESKFENIPVEGQLVRYGTVITSESFQYLKMQEALPLIRKLLRPGGRWIVCDYFRLEESTASSGHLWRDFAAALEQHGLRIVHQEDITPHVLPTLAFARLMASRLALPLKNFAVRKLRAKHPGLHYACAEALAAADERLEASMVSIDPRAFALRKRYLLLALEAA